MVLFTALVMLPVTAKCRPIMAQNSRYIQGNMSGLFLQDVHDCYMNLIAVARVPT